MSGNKRAVLVSEVGYRGMKDFSNSLLKEGLSVDIIIKGNINKEVLRVLAKPQGLRLCAIPKMFFWIYLFFYLLWHKLWGDIKTAVASKNQTSDWIRRFGFDVKTLVEKNNGYEII